MWIEKPIKQQQDLDLFIKNLSDKEKDALLETLIKEKWEREALIIKSLEEKYEKVKKLCENAFLIKNADEMRKLVNSNWKEIHNGLRFEGRCYDKNNNQFLKIGKKIIEPIISKEWEIAFKDYSTWKTPDIKVLKRLAKCKKNAEYLKKNYSKIVGSAIFNDIFYVKKKNNNLWFIVDSEWNELDFSEFVEYVETPDWLYVKRREGKNLKTNWYIIDRDFNEEKLDI